MKKKIIFIIIFIITVVGVFSVLLFANFNGKNKNIVNKKIKSESVVNNKVIDKNKDSDNDKVDSNDEKKDELTEDNKNENNSNVNLDNNVVDNSSGVSNNTIVDSAVSGLIYPVSGGVVSKSTTNNLNLYFYYGYGAPVYAIADGEIINSRCDSNPYQSYAVIRFIHNGSPVFAHYSSFCLNSNVNKQVKQGDIIGNIRNFPNYNSGMHITLLFSKSSNMSEAIRDYSTNNYFRNFYGLNECRTYKINGNRNATCSDTVDEEIVNDENREIIEEENIS